MQEPYNASYEIDYIPLTELIWGKGFIAPGGEGNVDRIVAGVDYNGKRVLELGSGAGGGTLVLAGKHGAQVVGLELEQPLVELSRQYAQEAGLSDQVEFRCVEPGPLPVEDASFDALYTSGVVCHIEDRHAFFNEVMRILKPGGMLLGYDWFVTTQSDAIDTWLQAAGLHLFQANLDAYLDGMRAVGFDEVSGEDVSAWYLKKANAELAELEGPLFEQATELSGAEIRDRMLTEWRAMNRVLKSGELKSGYFLARKPG
jgi:cyclopropane fatty-acyl-phospholipid synthase-like methyltransferase